MPELPEVETVRDGLSRFVLDRRIADVEVGHARSVRRHLAGVRDFTDSLAGMSFAAACRRGKYLWLPLARPGQSGSSAGDGCLVAHLGMSGQLLVRPAGAEDERHLHVRFRFVDAGPELRFVDQRTFGGLMIDSLVPVGDEGDLVPAQVAHIARDPLDPASTTRRSRPGCGPGTRNSSAPCSISR